VLQQQLSDPATLMRVLDQKRNLSLVKTVNVARVIATNSDDLAVQWSTVVKCSTSLSDNVG